MIDDKIIIEPLNDELEEWEKGLTPIQRFEKLIEYGQVAKLLQNSFFLSIDKAGQIDALAKTLDNLIHQLDKMAQTLMKVSSTHPEGVKINQLAVSLSRVKVKLYDDFAKGIDIVAQIRDKSKGERYF